MRHPDVAAAVRQERTVTAAQDIPLLPTVLSRIRLTTLALTEPGDVFYLVKEPGTVWLHDEEFACSQGHYFVYLGSEVRERMETVGAPGQTVVVLHNTKKFGVR